MTKISEKAWPGQPFFSWQKDPLFSAPLCQAGVDATHHVAVSMQGCCESFLVEIKQEGQGTGPGQDRGSSEIVSGIAKSAGAAAPGESSPAKTELFPAATREPARKRTV